MKSNYSYSGLPEDEKLDALLKTYGGITPAPDFNEAVWQRLSIDKSRNKAQPVLTWVRVNVKPFDAVAALAGVAAGFILSLQVLSHGVAPADPRFQILNSASLTGGYMQLASQGVK
ncbi:MAG: hypothetical protein WCO42_02950 [bacterium]